MCSPAGPWLKHDFKGAKALLRLFHFQAERGIAEGGGVTPGDRTVKPRAFSAPSYPELISPAFQMSPTVCLFHAERFLTVLIRRRAHESRHFAPEFRGLESEPER